MPFKQQIVAVMKWVGQHTWIIWWGVSELVRANYLADTNLSTKDRVRSRIARDKL